MSDQLSDAIKFLGDNGWDVEDIGEVNESSVYRCSVGDFSFIIAERPTLIHGVGVLTMLLPKGNDEVWSLIQLVLGANVEVVQSQDPVATE